MSCVKKNSSDLCISSRDFFSEQVQEAFNSLRITTYPEAQLYLVDLLEFFLDARNLFVDDEQGKRKTETLAELFLQALNVSGAQKFDLLKRLGDTSLYLSGFFGDSLQTKSVDIDYYVDIGGAAYSMLMAVAKDETQFQVFREFSSRFIRYVDVLTYISQEAMIQTNESVLRLYDKYMQTGSELARDKLIEMGLIALRRR